VVKRGFIFFFIFIGLIFLPPSVFAYVSGPCSNCHTMHYSQDGQPLGTDGPHQYLLIEKKGGHHSSACITCHSSQTSSTYEDLGDCKVPIVFYYGSSEPTSYLAGGNFWWVSKEHGHDDTKGHNVLGIAEIDQNLSEAPGPAITCANSCHVSLAIKQTAVTGLGSGCEGCHTHVRHHANDHPNGQSGWVNSAEQGWYRFLSAAHSVKPEGVEGYEHGLWEAGLHDGGNHQGATEHNEYLGSQKTGGYGFNGGLGHTVTAFCTGCHGLFHTDQYDSGWIRHPSDAIIPNKGEYANVGGDNHLYDPLSPVARQSLSDPPSDPGHVNPDSDMVMCLSCHRPHGSPYPDLLRWDYTQQIAGGGGDDKGCFYCHTQKND